MNVYFLSLFHPLMVLVVCIILILIHFFLKCFIYVDILGYTTVHVCRSKDNLRELVLSLQHLT